MKALNSCNLPGLSLFAAFTLLISLIIVGPYGVHAQINNAGNTITAQKMGVKITSPKTNQIVPTGPQTIEGTSSDTPNTNCQVYVDWNDTKPMQNVTARGPGGPNDYSNWTFTYTHNYHLIIAGMNELTSKITCNHDSAAVGNVTTKYYSINITGTGNAANFSLPTKSSNLSSTGTTGFYNAKFIPLLPQYSNSSKQSAAVNISNPNSEAATYDNISDNTNLIKETYSDDSSSSSSSKEDSHDNHNSDNNYKSSSDDSKDKGSGNKEKSNGNNKVEIHTAKHLKSTEVEKKGHDKDKLNFKHHNDNTKSGDLHKNIHDLIKKKIKRVSERMFD